MNFISGKFMDWEPIRNERVDIEFCKIIKKTIDIMIKVLNNIKECK